VVLSLGGFVSSVQKKEELALPLRDENIQGTIRQWLDGFGYGSAPAPDPTTEFSMVVSMPNSGKHVRVMREKQFNHYIAVSAAVTISPEHQALIAKLPEAERNRVAHNMLIELYRSGADSTVVAPSQVGFIKRIPITNALTEDVLIKTINSVEALENILVETVLRDLNQ
jgi:hypothetical protein